MRRAVAQVLVAVLAGALGAGCGGAHDVLRVVDGRVVRGDFVEPEAYAAFLRGAVADDRGDLAEALVAYDDASRSDHDDPEIWTRIGDVRCRRSAHDSEADAAIERALAIDRTYAPAWEARARCASRRGDPAGAVLASRRASELDPLDVGLQVALAHADDGANADGARARLVALTLLHGERAAAWDALATWGRAHRDATLVARALTHLAGIAPTRRASLADEARRLAGEGELAAARQVAAAVFDAGWRGDRAGDGFALLARLAIDDALESEDPGRVRARAVRIHLGLDVAAARALGRGDATLARDVAEPVLDADPAASGARMVLAVAATTRGDLAGRGALLRAASPVTTPLPGEVALVFARMLVQDVGRETGRDAARAFLAHLPRAALLPGDARTTSLAVDLAAQGVLDEAELTSDARIELAARRGDPPPVSALDAADARHRLLALSLLRPAEQGTLELARRLERAAPHDAVIAVALARISLAGARGAEASARVSSLGALDPTDPLVAAAALDVAVRDANPRAIPEARARLHAVARTPAERARVE
jgi:hypothetical protein